LDPADLSSAPRAPLGLLAALYGAGVALRNLLYDRSALPSRRLPVPTISVGNLSAGGTGKTPTVRALARKLLARGRRPGILSRGYRARSGPNEETRELAETLPGALLLEDPDRVRGGRALVAAGADVVLLDDGFQHRRLRRDLDLVLLDATRPFDRDRLLPSGLLREAPEALARADLVVLTRSDLVGGNDRERLWQAVGAIRSFPRIEARHAPVGVFESEADATRPVEWLRGRGVFLLAAIGNPRAFAATAESLGARARGARFFRDHHPYGRGDLEMVESARGGDPVLTTGKDWPKLRGRLRAPCLVLRVEVEFTSGEEDLDGALDRALAGRGSTHAAGRSPE
jgi:tetraacyldisaccharide 4'-kinase